MRTEASRSDSSINKCPPCILQPLPQARRAIDQSVIRTPGEVDGGENLGFAGAPRRKKKIDGGGGGKGIEVFIGRKSARRAVRYANATKGRSLPFLVRRSPLKSEMIILPFRNTNDFSALVRWNLALIELE